MFPAPLIQPTATRKDDTLLSQLMAPPPLPGVTREEPDFIGPRRPAATIRLTELQTGAPIVSRFMPPPPLRAETRDLPAAGDRPVQDNAEPPAAGFKPGVALSLLAHGLAIGLGVYFFAGERLVDGRSIEIPVELVSDPLPAKSPPRVVTAMTDDDAALVMPDTEAFAAASIPDTVPAVDTASFVQVAELAVDDAAPIPAAEAPAIAAAPAELEPAEQQATNAPDLIATTDIAATPVDLDGDVVQAADASAAGPVVEIAVDTTAEIPAEAVLTVMDADPPQAIDAPLVVASEMSVPPLAIIPTAVGVELATVAINDLPATVVDVTPRDEIKTPPPQESTKPARAAAKTTSAAKARAGRGARGGPTNAELAYANKLAAYLARKAKLPRARPGAGRTAIVLFTLSASGRASGVMILNGTGDAALDASAIQAVKRASPFPAIPPELATPTFIVRAPLNFR